MTCSNDIQGLPIPDSARVAIIDDWQGVAEKSIDWSPLKQRSEVVFFREPFHSEKDAAIGLKSFEIVLSMRERTRFSASLLQNLPGLKMLGITGPLGAFIDVDACTSRNILVCGTDYPVPTSVAASELALGLMLAVARGIPAADTNMRLGLFQEGLPVGIGLAGKTLGILGLGHLGSRMAESCRALGMKVQAWSEGLSAEDADRQGVRYVSKGELFSTSDVVSIHLRLSNRTTGLVGGPEFSKMRLGAILINTSRGPIVDEVSLLMALKSGRIRAGLDVFDMEPLPPDHPLRILPNVVLTPHLGYGIAETWDVFYGQSAENAIAFLDGNPVRSLNSVGKLGHRSRLSLGSPILEPSTPRSSQPISRSKMKENITNRPDDEEVRQEKLSENVSLPKEAHESRSHGSAEIDMSPLPQGMREKVETIEVSTLTPKK